jgi:acid stress-induced BolA-like protein IbaG/YrbA
MTNEEVKRLIETQLPESQVEIEGDGSHYFATIINDCFQEKKPLQRQQQVYSLINKYIASGDIHAFSMKTFTREEWTQRDNQ